MLPPLPSASPAATPSVRRVAANVGLFLAALIAVHLVLESCLPWPDAGEVSQKLAYFARHKDVYDAVFIGSSRICRQIAPRDFDDRVTALTGRPLRSFNLGAPSMFLPESLGVIDRVLALKPARLRWMFIELDDPKLRLEGHGTLVRREVYWHGWRETALMNVYILTGHGIRWSSRVGMLAHQWLLFGRRSLHLGRGLEWLADRFGGPDVPDDGDGNKPVALGPADDGYIPYRGTLGEGAGENLRADRNSFVAAAARLAAGGGRARAPQTAPPLLSWLLAERVAALRATGVSAQFIIAPVTTAEAAYLGLARDGVARPMFAFNDPAAYPALYDVNVRADTMHLNERGSLLFTRLLAERFASAQGKLRQ